MLFSSFLSFTLTALRCFSRSLPSRTNLFSKSFLQAIRSDMGSGQEAEHTIFAEIILYCQLLGLHGFHWQGSFYFSLRGSSCFCFLHCFLQRISFPQEIFTLLRQTSANNLEKMILTWRVLSHVCKTWIFSPSFDHCSSFTVIFIWSAWSRRAEYSNTKYC